MHPDDAVHIVPQDLPASSLASPLRALWRRYVEGWTWYAASGLTPPASEAAFPLARVRSPRASGRASAPCIHHPLELLFGGAAAAGCR